MTESTDQRTTDQRTGRMVDVVDKRLDVLTQKFHPLTPGKAAQPAKQPEPLNQQPASPAQPARPTPLPGGSPVPLPQDSVSQVARRIAGQPPSPPQRQRQPPSPPQRRPQPPQPPQPRDLDTPVTPMSAAPVLDAGSAVVWMMLKLEMIVAHFVDALWLRMSSTKEASDAVLRIALKQTELAQQQLCGEVPGPKAVRMEGPLCALAADSFTQALAAAATAGEIYAAARSEMRREVDDLKRQHESVLRIYDDTAATQPWQGGDVAGQARDLREHAELVYRTNRRAIQPRAQARVAEETGRVLQELRESGTERREQASLYGDAPISELNKRFRASLVELADTIRSQQQRS